MAVAVKVLVCPLATDEISGVMLMLVSAAALTKRLAAGEVSPLNDAVMNVVPGAMPVATPVVELTVEMPVLSDDQVT